MGNDLTQTNESNATQKALIVKFEALVQKSNNISSQIVELTNANEANVSKLNDTETKLENASNVIIKLQNINNECKEQLDKLQFEQKEALSMNECTKSALDEITQQLNNKRDELKQSEQEKEELIAKNNKLQTEYDEIKHQMIETNKKSMDDNLKKIGNLQENINKLTEIRTIQKEEIHNLNEENLLSKTKIVSLENDLE